MKQTSKVLALLLTIALVFSLATVASAAEAGEIKITNAAKGETYTIYKLFDAVLADGGEDSIAYKLPDGVTAIPTELTSYFSLSNGFVTAADGAWTDETKSEMSSGLQSALTAWVNGATATDSKVAESPTLTFSNLDYGYYVVTTSQGDQAISVDSTNPEAEIVDKNQTRPSNLTKTVNDTDVYFGQTITYTVTFVTSNYAGAGEDAKIITEYVLDDTLPTDFLEDVTVTSIVVDNNPNSESDTLVSVTGLRFETMTRVVDNKQVKYNGLTIPWYDSTTGKFLYNNGATVTVTYTAKIRDLAVIEGDGNTNTVNLRYNTEDSTDVDTELTDETTVYTYAIALKKVNENGSALANAEFRLPFYVYGPVDSLDGEVYTYGGTTEGDELTNTVTTGNSGMIVIKGVEPGTYQITETKAPNGYTMLAAPVEVTAVKTGATTTTITKYLNEAGEVVDEETEIVVSMNPGVPATGIFVVNHQGTELPETGGMGVTAFYIVGSVLTAGAVLLGRKRKEDE